MIPAGIVKMAVKENYQGRKVGSMLLEKCEERAQERANKTDKVAEVRLGAEKGTENYYKKRGFEEPGSPVRTKFEQSTTTLRRWVSPLRVVELTHEHLHSIHLVSQENDELYPGAYQVLNARLEAYLDPKYHKRLVVKVGNDSVPVNQKCFVAIEGSTIVGSLYAEQTPSGADSATPLQRTIERLEDFRHARSKRSSTYWCKNLPLRRR